jgi:hypothetical protein
MVYRNRTKDISGPKLQQDKQIKDLLKRIVNLPEENRPNPLVGYSILHENQTKNSIFNREVSFVQTFAEHMYGGDDYRQISKAPSTVRF